MSLPVHLRRPAVALGVVLALLAGAATIQAAAAWTATSAQLADRPPSVEQLQAALEAEQQRSLALQAQLDQLSSGSGELTTALQAARDRIAQDADQAKALQDSLAAAKKKLAALERSIRQAGTTTSVQVSTVQAPAAVAGLSTSGEPRGDEYQGDEHEGGGDD